MSDSETSTSEVPTSENPPSEPPTADPKTAEDGTEIKRNVSAEQWEEVGRRALRILLQERTREVDEAVGEIATTLDYGTPVDETHLKNLRDAIAGLENVAEYDLTDLVDDAVPFEQTLGRVSYGRMADALGVETDDLNRALELVEDGDEQVVDDSDGGDIE